MRDETLYEKVHELRTGFKYLELKSGRRVTFSDAREHIIRDWGGVVRWLSRMVKLANEDTNLGDWDWRQIEQVLDDMDALVSYYRRELERRQGDAKRRSRVRDRIRRLRNVRGRTPDEAAAFLAKADALERELG